MNTVPAPTFAPGRVLIQRYRLEEFITNTKLVEVWAGHDVILQRAVTIKLLLAERAQDEELAGRFRQEAIDAARLSHPNIVPTYDTGVDDDATFVVLGQVAGHTLAAALENGPLSTEHALLIARQFSGALAHIHHVGRAHGSLSPETVLLLGSDRRVLVTDAGLTASAPLDQESPFRAPETRDGTVDADARSDVFAAGALLRTMVTGSPQGKIADQRLGEVTTTATADAPEDRYAEGGALLAALTALGPSDTATEPRRVPLSVPKAPRPPLPPRGAEVDEETAPHRLGDTGQHSVTSAYPAAVAPPTAAHPVAPAPPEPAPAPVGPTPQARRLRRMSVVLAVLVVLFALALGIAINRLGSTSTAPPAATTTAVPIAVQATAFDPPPGDGAENNATARNAVDGNPATAWATQTYATRTFGNLKPGVGLVLQLPDAQALRSLEVTSDGQGWSAQIYVAANAGATLSSWGNPVDTQSGLGATARFDLHNQTGRYVLLWITDLGSANRLAVQEAVPRR